jgi:hypothetical protein
MMVAIQRKKIPPPPGIRKLEFLAVSLFFDKTNFLDPLLM